MKPIRSLAIRCLAVLAAVLLAGPALADPPARVGRLADMTGQVWIFDEQAGEWIAAARNRPITTGDRLSTESDARAEVQVGTVTWRLDANSELEVLQLDDAAVRLQLHNGSVAVRARNREVAGEVEVVTAEGRFVPQRAGHFRIDRDDDISAATVWSGLLNFRSEDSELDIEADQHVEFWQDDERTHYSKLEPAHDTFSEWVLAEDARASERSASARYVSPEVPGVEDLDRHGRWERHTEYGALWVPYHVAPGWAPYRYGHWAHVGPWGWNWVDDAPWGFAPFHYGRWVHFSGHWAWAPGSYIARPIYAPALVAWIGGPRLSIGVNIGGSRHPAVGWFPLGPREVYVPSYRVSPVYIRNVNITHVRSIDPAIIRQPTMAAPNQRYVNRFAPGAVTAVSADVISRRQPVGRHVDPRMVREIEREPVSVGLPVAALAARRDAAETPAQPRVMPPPPNRLSADPRVVRRQRGERPATAQLVPPSTAATTIRPSQQQRGGSSAGAISTPPVVVAPARIVSPRSVERPTAPASPAARHLQPSQQPRIFTPASPAARQHASPPQRIVVPRAPPVVVAPTVPPQPIAPPARPVAPQIAPQVAPQIVVPRAVAPERIERPVAPAVVPQAQVRGHEGRGNGERQDHGSRGNPRRLER